MHEAALKHDIPLIFSNSLQCQTKLCFNFIEPMCYSRSWPRSKSGRGKSNLTWKKNIFILPANCLLLLCRKNGLQAYIMSALLWSWLSNWYIKSLNIALCAVQVLRHRNRITMANLTSILKNHNLESFRKIRRKLAWLPMFLQWIILAHQAAFKIQGSTSVEVINNNRKPCWLNESKYLWNILMCPFVLHALNSIVVSDWHMKIIESS